MERHFTIPTHLLTQQHVSVFWQLNGHPPYASERILPIGVVEIIFNFSPRVEFTVQIGGGQDQLPRCFINGYNTVPLELSIPPHQYFFGVRFKPPAIRAIFGVPAGAFANQCTDLTLVDPTIDALWHQMGEHHSFAGRVQLFEQWLGRRVGGASSKTDLVTEFVDQAGPEQLSVSGLSQKLYVSPRQLSRKLQGLTGMNTEDFLQYKKYLQAIKLMHDTDRTLTDIAYDCHFFDQSHFIRVFRSYAEMTPGDYRKRKGFLKGHLQE